LKQFNGQKCSKSKYLQGALKVNCENSYILMVTLARILLLPATEAQTNGSSPWRKGRRKTSIGILSGSGEQL
jgi:hypothetical protein